MAQKAIQAVKQGHLKIVPSTHEELWFDWLDNIRYDLMYKMYGREQLRYLYSNYHTFVRDWCVSRQLWWGHCIPAYHFTIGDKTEWVIARTKNDAHLIVQNKYGPDIKLHQDQDVLDTWFSSAILPFAVLGWPKKVSYNNIGK